MDCRLIGVDLAKNVFEVGVSLQAGRVSLRRRVSRKGLLAFMAQQPVSRVIMEACSSCHYWGREIEALGHRVTLLPPSQVRPYRRGNKTDRADVKALLEAYRNEEIRAVPVKTVVQQTVTSLHRMRSAWMQTRTARINAVRGTLRELGVTIPVGRRHVLPVVMNLVEDAESVLTDPLRWLLAEAGQEILNLDTRILRVERQLKALACQIPAVSRLMSVPGIGLLTAMALVGFVGDLGRFESSRRFANSLGLTPREHSTGSRRWLGRISKRGDAYLRYLFIHGARSALYAATRMKRPDRLRAWALGLELRIGHNKAAVALANKMARIAWAVVTTNKEFESYPVAQAASAS